METGSKNNLRQRCYQFGLNAIRLADVMPNKRSSWILSDQFVRSATSIGANLVEATASSSRLEFKKFYEISLKSANETKYWLGLIRDANFADEKSINTLLSEVDELSKMIGAGVIKLKTKTF